MSGLFRKVSRRAKISGLRGWDGRIRTSGCRFPESRGNAFEFAGEFGATLERLGTRDFAALFAANSEIGRRETLNAGMQEIEPVSRTPCLQWESVFDFLRADEAIQLGVETTEKALENIAEAMQALA
jgi:hypothetical protein